MSATTLETSKAFIVEGRSGDYERSFWTVGVWTDKAKAEAERDRLTILAAEYWSEKMELGDSPDTKIPDAEWEPLFAAWEKESDALLDKFRAGGDRNLERFDQSEYFITETELHS